MHFKAPLSITLLLLAITLTFTACLRDVEVATKISYTDDELAVLSQVLNLPNPIYNYDSNRFGEDFFIDEFGNVNNDLLDHKATLGRVLFYEHKISQNNVVSCASCHHQENAFADPVAKSEGFQGELTLRNSLALGNMSGYGSHRFFWDERAFSVQEQTQMTMQDHIEMGADLELLPKKLDSELYRILFRKAFGSEDITVDKVSEALATFVLALNSFNSVFDQANEAAGFNTHNEFASFTTSENNGKSLYMANCTSCHGFDPGFPHRNTANNGLDLVYEDKGVGAISGFTGDDGRFKVPILRNVALTAPYMHDGRFATLEEVVEHYSTGIKDHPNLDHQLKSGTAPMRFDFTEEQKQDLVAFLNTFTDEEFTQDPRYADPFK